MFSKTVRGNQAPGRVKEENHEFNISVDGTEDLVAKKEKKKSEDSNSYNCQVWGTSF